MRRFRRVHGIETAAGEIPLSLYLFDCLYLDGRSLIDEPYEARWRKLSEISAGKYLAARKIVSDKNAAEAFLSQSLAAGHEGLMAKALSSPYMPGNRGKLWFKVKLAETIDCVIARRRSRLGAKARLALKLSPRCGRSRRRLRAGGKNF